MRAHFKHLTGAFLCLTALSNTYDAQSQELHQIARNQVSEETVVVTFKVEDWERADRPDNKMKAQIANANLIDHLDAYFKDLPNVVRATFDPATATVTVVGKSELELSEDITL